MNSPYDLYSWSKLYREEALNGARTRYLEGRLRTARNRPTRVARSVAVLMLLALLLVGSSCTGSDASSVNSDPVNSDASAISSSPAPDASNYAGMRDSGSMECYTFYSDGTVELRHGGTSTVSDSGTYQGDEQFGEIVWDSGRWTSTVVADGDAYIIDDAAFSPVDSCF